MSADELYRDDVREALEAAGWREDSRGHVVAPNGALWVETNDALDSGIDAPDKSWSVAFDSGVPAVVVVSTCLAAAGALGLDEDDEREPDVDGAGRTYESYYPRESVDDPGRCLEAHRFSPRDGWRMICGYCDHVKDAECHRTSEATS